MAVAPTTDLNLMDQAKRTDPDGTTADIVEMLMQKNDALDHMVWVEANDKTQHRTTARVGLPTPTWRKLNYGVPRGKSVTAQVDDGIGMLEIFARTDADLVDLAKDPGKFRFSEEKPFMESMAQTMAATQFYGDTDLNPERFMGLTPRFNDLTASTANSANVVHVGTHSGLDSMSVWLVTWGEDAVHGIFPEGGKAGLRTEDLGRSKELDTNSNEYMAYTTHYKWDAGLSVRDWRQVVRVQFDASVLEAGGLDADLMMSGMIDAYHQVEDVRPNTAIYARREFLAWFTKAAAGISGGSGDALATVRTTPGTAEGTPRQTFYGVPIYRMDQLTLTEAEVV